MQNILVIDDDPDIGLMIKSLMEYKGYAVSVLESSAQANKILKNYSIDLVILDMLLSGESGIDVIAGFKNDSAIAHIPVMMMSAHPHAKKICLQAGADDYISKPFDMQDIISKSNNLINRNNNIA
jgi:two-component system alkaline phosphatase synthesis response regulator PhoP